MNRTQRHDARRGRRDRRRRAQQSTIATPAARYAEGYRCPDCIAETIGSVLLDGVTVLDMAHDDTCPTYQRNRSATS